MKWRFLELSLPIYEVILLCKSFEHLLPMIFHLFIFSTSCHSLRKLVWIFKDFLVVFFHSLFYYCFLLFSPLMNWPLCVSIYCYIFIKDLLMFFLALISLDSKFRASTHIANYWTCLPILNSVHIILFLLSL